MAREISQKADAFFKDVYALPGVHTKALKGEEKAFWARYARLMAAHGRAKLDEHVKADVRVALGKRFPDALCRCIVAYVQ